MMEKNGERGLLIGFLNNLHWSAKTIYGMLIRPKPTLP